LRSVETNGERNRQLFILKSRGMAHSNQLREFLLTEHGIELVDVYLGPEGVLTGSARLSQEAREQAATVLHQQTMEGLLRDRDRKRAAFEARLEALRREFEVEDQDFERLERQEQLRQEAARADRINMLRSRHGDSVSIDGQPSTVRRGRK
jgi:circadian clock protein KaiC